MTGYGKVSLFVETKATLIRRSTTFLKGWVAKYLEITANKKHMGSTDPQLADMIYCQPCTGEQAQVQHINLGELQGSDRGDRDGSSDLLPP